MITNNITILLASVITIAISIEAHSDIAFLNSSVNSLAISSERLENDNNYILKIYLEGIKTASVKTKVINNKIYITAQNGGNISRNAFVGGQFVHYSYPFPRDADLVKLTRIDTKNLITLSIPKIKF